MKSNSSKKVTFELEPKDLFQINYKGEKEWMKGKYKLVVANSLPSKRSSDLGASAPISQIIELK
jgi:beta-glucosidase